MSGFVRFPDPRPGRVAQVSIVIPAFDEAGEPPGRLDACLELGPVLGEALEVVVVDDHSAGAQARSLTSTC
ncbi:MAG: glycosyltransferase [Acidimicrobiia bacterium]|nr:glycosyltransferase [Acidimicrobiia bacterium]